MKLTKQRFETDKGFFNRIIENLKSGEVQISKDEIETFLNYLHIYKLGSIQFTILYDSKKEYVSLISPTIEVKCVKDMQQKINFKSGENNLKCYNLNCIHNKYYNKLYTCTKQYKYENCELKLLTPQIE